MSEFRKICVSCGDWIDSKPTKMVPLWVCGDCWTKLTFDERLQAVRRSQQIEFERREYKRIQDGLQELSATPLTDEARIIKALENIVRILHPVAAGIQRTEKVMDHYGSVMQKWVDLFTASKKMIDDGPPPEGTFGPEDDKRFNDAMEKEIDHDWSRDGNPPPDAK